MIKKETYIQFEDLKKEEKVGHLFTKKPFDFCKTFVSQKQIEEEYQEIENLLNLSSTTFIKPIQKHTAVVQKVDSSNLHDSFDNVDGLITNLKDVALVTSLADCQGVLLYDKEKGVIGNIHSGWKGTIQRIVPNAILLMQEEYGCNPKDIKVYICPSILACCFEVDEDVKDTFVETFTDIPIHGCIQKGEIKDGKQKYFIDTLLVQKYVLETMGILKENIVASSLCTKCHADIFHSYRAEKEKSGRNVAVIVLRS